MIELFSKIVGLGMDRYELAALCALHSIKGVGNKTLRKIKDNLGGFQICWTADPSRLLSFLPAPLVESIIKARSSIEPLEFWEELTARQIKTCCIEDPDYPALLANIFDPPYLFYYYGKRDICDRFCLAVVGSRSASTYGKNQARRFGRDLAEQGLTVVSGLARGIDSEAHRGVLETGGNTIAVLGCGLDIVYPRENQALFSEIREKGMIISEFPVNTPPEPGNFPVRNRIISGLSHGVLVVEAQKKSGALITADFALEQGRDVFAVPGPVTSRNSEGTNNLIKQGARLVSSVDDILEDYGLNQPQPVRAQVKQDSLFEFDQDEILLGERVTYEPKHFDELLAETSLTVGQVSTALLKMELKGIIKGLPGNYYVKI